MDIDVVWFLQGQSCVVNAYQEEVSAEIVSHQQARL